MHMLEEDSNEYSSKSELVGIWIKIHLNPGREFSLTLPLERLPELNEYIFYLHRLYPLKNVA
jgi:hypothetical protein